MKKGRHKDGSTATALIKTQKRLVNVGVINQLKEKRLTASRNMIRRHLHAATCVIERQRVTELGKRGEIEKTARLPGVGHFVLCAHEVSDRKETGSSIFVYKNTYGRKKRKRKRLTV